MKKLLLFAGICCIAIAACKKSDDNNGSGSASSRADTLTSGKWVLSSIKAYFQNPLTGSNDSANIYDSVSMCARDDQYIFLKSGKVNIDQGAVKCDSTAPQQAEAGSWTLNSTKDTLVMDGVLPVGTTYKIVGFSNTSMQLQRDSTISGVLPLKVLASFSHQ